MNIIRKLVMAELPAETLLSSSSREKCVANLRDLPTSTYSNKTPTLTAAVLVPICVVDGEVSLLYTLRSAQLKRNSGQVSFPGGKTDDGETSVHTALRETEEELGIPRHTVDVWGTMPPVQGADKNMVIHPVVGMIKDFNMSQLNPSEDEVEAVFTVPVKQLCDPSTHGHYEFKEQPLPVFLSGNYKIWGITGYITHSFLKCFVESDMANANFLGRKYELHELMPNSKL
ncbi:mitochondrial coenzyme A diphosphatase NUDT8 [Plutella xylostella]|uniref:mitochondrial coenzyme A diphosphatase NUDT8 n=1 Tax=Plutella xylostella TaxID=51655 RepID=UPI002032BF7A|nr:mitochondrial coenzyme A diphosphatase NUDT8 [Plutella xylostella]